MRMYNYINTIEVNFDKKKIIPNIDFNIKEIKAILSNIKNCCTIYVDKNLYNTFNNLFFDGKSFKITRNTNDVLTTYVLSHCTEHDLLGCKYIGNIYIGRIDIWSEQHGNNLIFDKIKNKFEYIDLKLTENDNAKLKMLKKDRI